MRRSWRSEEGWALVTAMILMTVMLGAGVATATMVDAQTRQSAVTRERDTAFNLAEAALNAQVYALSLRWPGFGFKDAPAYASHSCSSSGLEPVLGPAPSNQQQMVGATPLCPSPATLAPLLNNVDAQGASSWSTWVFDDPSPTGADADRGKHYSDALVAGEVAYDRNKDGKLWVKARASARGHTRTLVSLVKVETMHQDIKNTALLAGSLVFSNNGNHSGYFIDQSTATAPNVMTVRCDPAADPNATCLGYPQKTQNWEAKLGGAIDPPNYTANQSEPNALDAATLDTFMTDALSDDSYYDDVGPQLCSQITSTPPTQSFTVLYIKNCGLVHWSAGDLGSADKPVLIIFDNTQLKMTGNGTIHGVVYFRNPPAVSPAIEMKGCTQIAGSLIVDGAGTANVGSCAQEDRPQLLFVPSAFSSVRTYASAGIIQNTWRELPPQ